MKLSLLPVPKAIHAILYGPPKSGKTRLLGEMAEHGFFIDLLDLENGSGTLIKSLSPEAKERVNVIRIPDTRSWPIAIETVMKLTKLALKPENAKEVKICEMHGKIDCPLCKQNPLMQWNSIDFSKYTTKNILAIDSSTQLSISSMNQITKGLSDEEFLNFKAGWDEYGKQGTHLGYVFGNIQNAPIHIIVTSHEMGIGTEENEKEEKLVPVAGTKNFSRTVAKYFDEVIYMHLFNRRHQAISETIQIKNVLAGSRADVELSKMEKPSLLEIFTGERPVVTQQQAATAVLQGLKK